jgi:hypothetical protein
VTPFGFVLQGGQLQASVLSNNLTIAIKTTAGADPSTSAPVTVMFRDQTATGGNQNTLNIIAATSFTVNSGSTLGAANATPFRFWVVGFNDAGTFRLGVINCSAAGTIYALPEYGLQSSMGGNGGTSAGTFYTGTGVTGKPFRILGYMEWSSGLTTAGVWVSGPTAIQLFGPGIKKPGDPVQENVSSQIIALDTGNSTTTFLEPSTAVRASITPTSTINPIFVSLTATVYSSGASLATARVVRGVGGTIQVGNNITSVNNTVATGSMQGYDLPQTTNPQTYVLQRAGLAGTAAVCPYTNAGPPAWGSDVTWVIREIMG